MVTSQCSSCGAPVPAEARYCPRCGRGVSENAVPVFDLAAPTPTAPSPEDRPRDRSTATVVGVVLGVIAVVIGLSVLSGGGSDDPDDSEEQAAGSTTSSTVGSRPTTSSPATSAPRTTIGPLLSGDVLLDPDLGLALVVFRQDGQVVVSDLATGAQRVISDSGLGSTQAVRWVGSSFVGVGPNGEVRRLATDGSGEWSQLSVPEGAPIDFVWGSANRLFWAPAPGADSPALLVALGDDGALTTYAGPPAFNHWSLESLGLVGDLLVFNSYDGTFGLSPDGDLRRLGFGRVVGVEGNYLVRNVCDEEYVCHLVREELVAGDFAPDRQVILMDATPSNLQRAYPAPDGRSVAVLSMPQGQSVLQVIAVGDDGTASEPVTLDVRIYDDPSFIAWADEGRSLAWWDASTREAQVVTRIDEGGFEVASIRASVHSATNPWLVHVVPLAQLPPDWIPHLG